MLSAVRYLGFGALVALTYSAGSFAQDDLTPADAAPASAGQGGVIAPAPATASASAETELATVPLASPEAEPARDARPAVRNRVIEEIVVTAQKREDLIQDVPIAIQAFSDDSLSARNIGATDQLGALVPSMRFTQAAGYTLIYLRGIGTSQFVPSADPSIATYVDGIYVPQGQAGTQSLGNIERVEVLKGPQGTLFGRNTIGGAINVITKGPDRDVLTGSAAAQYTDLERGYGTATASFPLTDWLAMGISGAYQNDESYIRASTFDVPDGVTRTARVQLDFHPGDNFSLMLTGYLSKQNDVNLAIGQNSKPKLLGTLTLAAPQGDDFVVSNDVPAASRAEQRIVYGIASYSLPWLDLKFLASAQEIAAPQYDYDFDGTPLPLVAFDSRRQEGLPGQYIHLQTAELQFISNDDTWLSDRFEWVAGLYYFHSIGAFDPARFRVAPNVLQSGAALFGANIPQGLLDLLNATGGDLPGGQDGITLSLSGVLETDSYSAYAQGTYTFTDWLDVTLGGRFQMEDRYLTKSETNLYNPVNGAVTDIPPLNYPLIGEEESNFSPKAQISVRPRDGAMIYASYGEGYKSGTYNIVAIYTAPKYIKPERVKSYELGAKVDFLDGNLRLNTALFYNDIENLQDGFVSLLSGGAVSFNTAKGARTKGVEVDGVWLPLPELNPGLVVTGNAAYVDAIYTDFKNGEGFTEPTGIYSANLDLSGSNLRNTPEFSGSLGIVQTFALEDGSIEIGIDEVYSGRFFYNANNTVSEDPYLLTSARVSYEYEPWQLRVTLFGQNLTNERYHLAQFETDFGLLTTLAAPREFGVRVNWQF